VSGLARLLGTWFGLGYVPKAPGTAGSLGGLLAAWAMHVWWGVEPAGFAVLALLLLGPAAKAAGRMARDVGNQDPPAVVVDEVVGQWLTLAGAMSLDGWMPWAAAFVLFRALDILKPPPVRALERVSGGAGIVLDDAMAGVYGALVLWAAGRFASIGGFLYGST
jgi:phosphatidylglycerophosphatase A